MSITFGFFKDFLGSDTLLLVSTPSGFLEFSDRLRGITLRPEMAVDLKSLGWVSKADLSAVIIGAPTGSFLEIDGNDRRLVWRLASSEREAVIDKLTGVAQHSGPAHEFLETIGEFQIIASAGEYPESLFEKQTLKT